MLPPASSRKPSQVDGELGFSGLSSVPIIAQESFRGSPRFTASSRSSTRNEEELALDGGVATASTSPPAPLQAVRVRGATEEGEGSSMPTPPALGSSGGTGSSTPNRPTFLGGRPEDDVINGDEVATAAAVASTGGLTTPAPASSSSSHHHGGDDAAIAPPSKSRLADMLSFNDTFVASRGYDSYKPAAAKGARRIVVITCMDSRLIELLPKAINVKTGEAKIIKTAGAILTHPFGGGANAV